MTETTKTGQAAPKVLKGKYEVLEPSMAETERSFVFKGKLLPEGHDIAVKILKERFSQDPPFMDRYASELRATSNLPEHPALLKYHEIDTIGRRFCVIMEYFPAPSALALLQGAAPVPYPLVLAVMRQLTELLEFGLKEGLQSRNVDLDDVLVRESDRRIKLQRFRARRAASGTAARKPASAASDLLFLGRSLYELVTGKRYPESRETPEILADSLLEAAKIRYPALTGEEATALSKLFVGTTTRDFAHRLDSYEAVAAALDSLEKLSNTVQEERRRAELARAAEETKETYGSAYDTVALLTGRGAKSHDDPAVRELSRPLDKPVPEPDPNAEPGGLFSAANLAIAAVSGGLVLFVWWLFYR